MCEGKKGGKATCTHAGGRREGENERKQETSGAEEEQKQEDRRKGVAAVKLGARHNEHTWVHLIPCDHRHAKLVRERESAWASV